MLLCSQKCWHWYLKMKEEKHLLKPSSTKVNHGETHHFVLFGCSVKVHSVRKKIKFLHLKILWDPQWTLSPTLGSTQDHQKFKPNVWEHCLACFEQASLVLRPEQPIPCPPPPEEEPFPNLQPDSLLMQIHAAPLDFVTITRKLPSTLLVKICRPLWGLSLVSSSPSWSKKQVTSVTCHASSLLDLSSFFFYPTLDIL